MFNEGVKHENFRNMYSKCFKQLRELSPEYFISIALQNNKCISQFNKCLLRNVKQKRPKYQRCVKYTYVNTHETEQHSLSVYSDHYSKDISKPIPWQEERVLEKRVTFFCHADTNSRCNVTKWALKIFTEWQTGKNCLWLIPFLIKKSYLELLLLFSLLEHFEFILEWVLTSRRFFAHFRLPALLASVQIL